MDVLGRILGGGSLRASGVPGPSDDFWYQPVGTLSESGVRVDEQSAQKISAWYRGRDLLATVLAMLPLPVYERLPNDGGANIARNHPLFDILHDKPNSWQDSFQWRRQKMFDLVDHGNAYDWIVPGARGFVDQLCPIEPTLVTPKQQYTTFGNGAVIPGRVLYDVRNPITNITKTFTQDEIFHLRGASDDGVVGKGILQYARSSLGTALATESYAAQIYSRGTLNGGVIENPGTLDPDASKRMAASFITAAKEWHLPKVLEQGSKFVPNKMTPEDAQMLLSRKFTVDDVARWLGIPRQMLENSDPSFGNANQFDDNFIAYSMGGWLSLFEFAFADQLILQPQRYFAQFTREALARGDLAVRWEAHVKAVNAGIKSVDEVRGVENLNKRGGKADELRDPQNITGKPTAGDPSASPPPSPAPPKKTPPVATTADDRLRAIVTQSAARVLRKEIQAAQKAAVKWAADADGWIAWVDAFYADHHVLVMQTMLLDEPTARGYIAIQRAELQTGLAVTDSWTPEYLASLAVDHPVHDPLPGLLKAAIEKPAPSVQVPVTIEKGAIQATLQPAAVTVNQAPVTVHGAPVTIAKGAIDVQAPVSVTVPGPKSVKKTVKRDANKQITEVREDYT